VRLRISLTSASMTRATSTATTFRRVNSGLPSRRAQRGDRVFNLLMRLATGLPFRDAQCGFKLFEARAAREDSGGLPCLCIAYTIEDAMFEWDRNNLTEIRAHQVKEARE
jgi:hypothetical protein